MYRTNNSPRATCARLINQKRRTEMSATLQGFEEVAIPHATRHTILRVGLLETGKMLKMWCRKLTYALYVTSAGFKVVTLVPGCYQLFAIRITPGFGRVECLK